MFSSLRRGTAWRWVAAFVLVVAVALPLMPTAAYAASSDTSVATGGKSGQCADIYWVKKGDNLSRIARWYGVSVHAIVRANHISNPSIIVPGQRLCIPFRGQGWDDGHQGGWNDGGGHPGGGHQGGWNDGGGHHGGRPSGCWYTVQKGDNLSEIASWFGVSWSYLARVNHLSNPRVIVPGQVLYVCW